MEALVVPIACLLAFVGVVAYVLLLYPIGLKDAELARLERDVAPLRHAGVVSELRAYGAASCVTVVVLTNGVEAQFVQCEQGASRAEVGDSIFKEPGSLGAIIRKRTGEVVEHDLDPSFF